MGVNFYLTLLERSLICVFRLFKMFFAVSHLFIFSAAALSPYLEQDPRLSPGEFDASKRSCTGLQDPYSPMKEG